MFLSYFEIFYSAKGFLHLLLWRVAETHTVFVRSGRPRLLDVFLTASLLNVQLQLGFQSWCFDLKFNTFEFSYLTLSWSMQASSLYNVELYLFLWSATTTLPLLFVHSTWLVYIVIEILRKLAGNSEFHLSFLWPAGLRIVNLYGVRWIFLLTSSWAPR